MQITFSDDQVQFRNLLARFLQDKSSPAEVRRLMATQKGCDPAVWRQLCDELGLAGTHIPEAFGGFGFGPVELGIAAEEMGRFLYCGPFFASSVMAVYGLLLGADDSAREKLLPGLAKGTSLATLVLDNLNNPTGQGQSLRAEGGRLTGTAPLVLDAGMADLLIVVAGEKEGLALFSLAADAKGVQIQPLQALDETRKLYRVDFSGAEADRAGDLSPETLEDIWDHICVALAHELIGSARHLLDSTVEYTKLRYQFGRPVGSFQGLKHRLADLLMELDLASAATHHAARCLATREGESWAPAMAKAMAAETCMKAAREAIQMRGGIGFTWEENTHLWYKRAKSSEVFMGTPALHRERMMCRIEAEGEAA